jgi:hypothetical protein
MARFRAGPRVFVALTHGTVADRPQQPAPFANSIFGSDLFFSSHRSAVARGACLLAHPQWRMFYFALTAFFSSIVLLGHYHYSIDVLAALFITYTASIRCRTGYSAATTRCFVLQGAGVPRQNGQSASGSKNGRPRTWACTRTIATPSVNSVPGGQSKTGVANYPKCKRTESATCPPLMAPLRHADGHCVISAHRGRTSGPLSQMTRLT